MKFSEALKYLRKSRKMTQEQLAEVLGVKKMAIHSYENEKRKPDFDAVVKIEMFFGKSIIEIMETENQPDNPEKKEAIPKEQQNCFGCIEHLKQICEELREIRITMIEIHNSSISDEGSL